VRRTTRRQNDAPGHDSFLDIVTNIVGILIILVMVVGVRAKDAWVDAAEDEPVPKAGKKQKTDVNTPAMAASNAEADIHEISGKINAIRGEIIVEHQRRAQLQLLVETVKRRLQQRREQMDAAAREQFDLDCEVLALREQLDTIKRQQKAVENSRAPVTVIEHLPTPLAQTVFGKEAHFRLLHGRLAYVPMNELVDRLKSEWQQKLWKLKSAPQVTETIGPLQGFRMKYTLERKAVTDETRVGRVVRQMFGLSGFVLVPVSDDLGEPLDEALRPDSEFRRLLAELNPDMCTITVWCYPDTFDEFRVLKKELHRLGYRTAGRPLPEGCPIGGSPTGSKSAAQ